MPDEQALPPAGWYTDPENPAALRWWDGHQWGPVAPDTAPQQQPSRDAQKADQGTRFAIAGGIIAVGGFVAEAPIIGVAGIVMGAAGFIMWMVKS